MKVFVALDALVLSTVATPSRDGQQTYYKLSILDKISGEAGTLKCTEEAAKMAVPMTECRCQAEYNDTYNPPTFRITHVAQLETGNGTAPGAAKK